MTKTLRDRTLVLGAILTLLASPTRAQDSAGGGTWGFVNVRYDSRASASIYTGYGWHRAFAMGGMSHNPRSGYAEVLGGVGFTMRTGAAEHWVAVASARAGQVSFAQIYWLPSVRMGGLTARANVKWVVAYEGTAAQKVTIAPVSITAPVVGRRLSGGVAMDMVAAERARPTVGMGPQLRLKLPRASLAVDALRDVTGNSSRVRLFFASGF
jgi:hypothetical protein